MQNPLRMFFSPYTLSWKVLSTSKTHKGPGKCRNPIEYYLESDLVEISRLDLP